MTRMLGWFSGRGLNFWVAFALIVANVYAWAGMLLNAAPPYVVAAVRAPQIVQLLDHIQSGNQSGETWEITLTERQAEETITWYLQRYPQIPFAHPQVHITPDYVGGEGDATIAGLRVHVGGRAQVTLANGLPVVKILDLNLPLPPPVRQALEDELEVQLHRADSLPVRFTSAEWRQGEVTVKGFIR